MAHQMKYIMQKWKIRKILTDCKYNQLITLLDSIIKPEFKISNSGGNIIFNEPQTKPCKCKQVTISTCKKVFALSLDIKGLTPFNCFNNSAKEYTKKNDGILFCGKGDKLVILLIELKSNNSGEYLKQLKAGRNFVQYLISQINTFSELNILSKNIIYRGIIFKTRNIPSKGTTKKNKLTFTDRSGLLCCELSCNATHSLCKIKEAI